MNRKNDEQEIKERAEEHLRVSDFLESEKATTVHWFKS